jgi:hypothetical protein
MLIFVIWILVWFTVSVLLILHDFHPRPSGLFRAHKVNKSVNQSFKMCAYELRSANSGSENGSVSSWSSFGSTSSGSYKYRGKKYGNKNRKKLVRCCAKTLSGKRCSRKCDPTVGNVCYQHSVEYKLEQVQKSMALKDQKMVEMQLNIAALIIRVQELEAANKNRIVEPVVKKTKTTNWITVIDLVTYFVMAMVFLYYYDQFSFDFKDQCAIGSNETLLIGDIEMVW